jgi:hypothetical protein
MDLEARSLEAARRRTTTNPTSATEDGTMEFGPGPTRLPTTCPICGALIAIGLEEAHAVFHKNVTEYAAELSRKHGFS